MKIIVDQSNNLSTVVQQSSTPFFKKKNGEITIAIKYTELCIDIFHQRKFTLQFQIKLNNSIAKQISFKI